MVFTDGQASDGQRLKIEAEKLKALADRNQTVSVVAVGFGQVDVQELKLIASSDENVIMAQGANAAAGFANLKKMLDKLVDKVCEMLPEDCVLEYTPWSACDAPWPTVAEAEGQARDHRGTQRRQTLPLRKGTA